MSELKNKIRELLSPHFGYESLYMRWSSEVSFKKLVEIHGYIKGHKNNIKLLRNPIATYSYYNILSELLKIEKDVDLKRLFKNGLNGKSRKFFESTFVTHRKYYDHLINNDIKLKMFFRTSSRPQSIDDYKNYLNQIISYNDESYKTIERIEKFDHFVTSKGAYLFKLEKNMLDMVPPTWCIHNSDSEYEREIRDRNLNSIWLLFDPITNDDTRRIVGIDLNDKMDTLLYMDTNNNRFTNNLPIRISEFLKLVSDKLVKKVETHTHVSRRSRGYDVGNRMFYDDCDYYDSDNNDYNIWGNGYE